MSKSPDDTNRNSFEFSNFVGPNESAQPMNPVTITNGKIDFLPINNQKRGDEPKNVVFHSASHIVAPWRDLVCHLPQISISLELQQYLEQLCRSTGKTEEEVLKAALSLFGLAVSAKANDKKMGVVEPETPTITEVVGF